MHSCIHSGPKRSVRLCVCVCVVRCVLCVLVAGHSATGPPQISPGSRHAKHAQTSWLLSGSDGGGSGCGSQAVIRGVTGGDGPFSEQRDADT